MNKKHAEGYKVTKEVEEQIIDAVRWGVGWMTACKAVGISHQTLLRMRKKVEFVERIKAAQAECHARCEKIIQTAAVDDYRAAQWWLERKKPEKYGKRLELSGTVKSGKTMSETIAELPIAKRQAVIDSLRAAGALPE